MPRELSCFVIIPSNWNGKAAPLVRDDRWGSIAMPSCMEPPRDAPTVDFEQVYKHIIQAAITNVNREWPDAPIKCTRGQEINQTGDIRKQVIEQICKADLTITDITTNNPNVFLEYGIRLSVKDSGNLLMCHKDAVSRLPFNIEHLRVTPYSMGVGEAQDAQQQIEQLLHSYHKGQSGPERNVYYEYVELFTGRLLEKKLAQMAREAPPLISTLATAILATGDAGRPYREPVFDYLMKYREALAANTLDQKQVIEHLKLIADIQGLGPGRIRQTLYELAKICNADPDRKAEGEGYLEKAKKLED